MAFSVAAIPWGGTLVVNGASRGGWVFCGVERNGCGPHLVVSGGAARGISGLSGDDLNCSFELSHDGSAAEVLVEFSTRPD